MENEAHCLKHLHYSWNPYTKSLVCWVLVRILLFWYVKNWFQQKGSKLQLCQSNWNKGLLEVLGNLSWIPFRMNLLCAYTVIQINRHIFLYCRFQNILRSFRFPWRIWKFKREVYKSRSNQWTKQKPRSDLNRIKFHTTGIKPWL